jgi:hypothetical protein
MGSNDTLRSLETRFLELRRRLYDARWDLYARHIPPDLDEISAALHALATEASTADLPAGRRSDVLLRVLARELVDSRPDVAALVNRLTTGTGYPSLHQDGLRAKAQAVEPDVIELIELRNEISRTTGARDYADFVTSLQRLDVERIRVLIRRIQAEEVTRLAHRRGTSFSDPNGEGSSPSGRQLPIDGPAEALHLLQQLGLDRLHPMIAWLVDPNGFPYDCPVSVPDDIRVMLPVTESLDGLAGVFHELGHAVMHVGNTQTGVLTSWNELWDESMAMTMERIGTTLLFDRAHEQAKLHINARERLRLSTSFLFELDVIEDPRRARESYRRWHEPLTGASQPELWALDTFRVEDPVHVHTYVIGEIVAEATIDHLRDRFDDDHHLWGEWLRSSFYEDGRRSTLIEKLDRLGEHRPADVADLVTA